MSIVTHARPLPLIRELAGCTIESAVEIGMESSLNRPEMDRLVVILTGGGESLRT